MKSPEQWTSDVIQYLRENPSKNPAEARQQITNIIKMIQDDAITVWELPSNDNPGGY